jgi:hypothetical protein
VNDKIAAWDLEGSEAPLDQCPIDDDLIDDLSGPAIDYAEALKFLMDSKQFKELLTKIQASLLLTARDGTMMDRIGREIRAQLSGLGGKDVPEAQKATFDIAWDPAEFLKQQEYQENPYSGLGNVIAIVGTAIDAQATTCAQYMQQTWPLTGIETLRAIEASLAINPGVNTCEYDPLR